MEFSRDVADDAVDILLVFFEANEYIGLVSTNILRLQLCANYDKLN